MSPVVEVDARGHRCPVPTLRLRRALQAAAAGSEVRLLADDPMARVDVPHFASEAGAELVAVDELAGGGWAFRVRKC
ncbi:MAG TPA: sulfurtransferase TusA family protein [Caulobacteraceae bacterium]|jgi:tRNA 2-thiouridine synthesizing protein A